MLSGLAAQKEDPNAIAQVVGNAILYGKDHPYGEAMTEKTVESITLQLCTDYYKTYFRPNVAYLAVVGDITKAEAEDLIKKYPSKVARKREQQIVVNTKDEQETVPEIKANVRTTPGIITQRGCTYAGCKGVVLGPTRDILNLTHGPIGCGFYSD